MRLGKIPFAVQDPDSQGLSYMACEISYGGAWVNLNNHDQFVINAASTRENSQRSWRKITTTSPVLGGNYLIHAVPEMVSETISVWITGNTQTDLADNLSFIDELFEQFDYRIRWTYNEYREYWRCQLAEASTSQGQVWTHSQMAMATYQVPRYPSVDRERIG